MASWIGSAFSVALGWLLHVVRLAEAGLVQLAGWSIEVLLKEIAWQHGSLADQIAQYIEYVGMV